MPIFDDAHVASIGALALAPSNPNIIYVGTGEETAGNGMYRSDDAGKTWKHIGLEDKSWIVQFQAHFERSRSRVEHGQHVSHKRETPSRKSAGSGSRLTTRNDSAAKSKK